MPPVSSVEAEAGADDSAPPLYMSHRRLVQRVRQKTAIIHDLIEGRLSLIEATRQFQDVHCGSIAMLENSVGVPSGPTDPETMCRNLIGWAALELSDRPEQAEVVSHRLERELEQHMARHGEVALSPATG